MSIEITTITAPSAWASALVNGDYSGLQDPDFLPELVHLYRLLRLNRGWAIVDVARDAAGEGYDPRFTWAYQLYGGTTQGGQVLDYVAHRRVLHPGQQEAQARKHLMDALARRRAAKRPETA